jgi:hypothetical protein
MSDVVIAALVIAVAAVILGWLFVRQRAQSPSYDSDFSLDNWQPSTVRPLMQIELKALADIQRAAPNCIIMPQVSLSRFLKVKKSVAYRPWFYRVGRRCVDFLICSPNGDVLGVVELDDAKTATATPSRGVQAKERCLTLASIPVWHINPETKGAYDQLFDFVRTALGEAAAHQQQEPEWHPTENAPRGAGIEALELDDERWNQPWPTEDTRPSAYLDIADIQPASPMAAR